MSAQQHVEEFLDLYKRMEKDLRERYGDDDSVVYRFENSQEAEEIREELKACREIRNLLQHNPKINGNYIVDPSDDIIDMLRSIIELVEHPPLAIDFGVGINQLYKTTMNGSLTRVITVMKERGFSQIPVMKGDCLIGVVSAYSVFEFCTELGAQIITEETRVSAMAPYLPIEKHKNEAYRFMPKSATFFDADEAFMKRDNKGHRLVALFITENGKPNEPLLSMLTPWSVVGH